MERGRRARASDPHQMSKRPRNARPFAFPSLTPASCLLTPSFCSSEAVLQAQVDQHALFPITGPKPERERESGNDLETAREVDRGAKAWGNPRRFLCKARMPSHGELL